MAHNMSNLGRSKGGESDHICAERARLKQGAEKHFAQRQGAQAILSGGGGRRGRQAGDTGKSLAAGVSDNED